MVCNADGQIPVFLSTHPKKRCGGVCRASRRDGSLGIHSKISSPACPPRLFAMPSRVRRGLDHGFVATRA
jgi:hypothetical protein